MNDIRSIPLQLDKHVVCAIDVPFNSIQKPLTKGKHYAQHTTGNAYNRESSEQLQQAKKFDDFEQSDQDQIVSHDFTVSTSIKNLRTAELFSQATTLEKGATLTKSEQDRYSLSAKTPNQKKTFSEHLNSRFKQLSILLYMFAYLLVLNTVSLLCLNLFRTL